MTACVVAFGVPAFNTYYGRVRCATALFIAVYLGLPPAIVPV